MKENKLLFEEIYDSGVEELWKAITDKDAMKEWYFDISDFILEEGATFNFYEPGSDKKFHHKCTIQKIISLRELRYTWTYPELSTGKSIVSWQLDSRGQKTKVILSHQGVETFNDGGLDFKIENYKAGWNEILTINLKRYLKKNQK